MRLELVRYDDPILLKESEDFDFNSPPVDPEELALSLVEKMREVGSIGLSSNQVGLPYKVFAMEGEPCFVCFNARVVQPSEETISMEETCHSYPGVIISVTRPKHVRCRFQGPDGDTYTKTFTGMSARIFQHEIDHGLGKNFFSYATRPKIDLSLRKAKKLGHEYHHYKLRARA